MIFPDLNASPTRTVLENTRHQKVMPIHPSQRLLDCLTRKRSWNGDKESEQKSQTKSQAEQQDVEQEFTIYAKTICPISKSKSICLITICGKTSRHSWIA